MPLPPADPMAVLLSLESRLLVPLLAQLASYLAASARMRSFSREFNMEGQGVQICSIERISRKKENNCSREQISCGPAFSAPVSQAEVTVVAC